MGSREGSVWGGSGYQGEEQGGRCGDKWGGARPAAARERRKWAGTTVVVREHGRREGGPGLQGCDRCVCGPARRNSSFFDLIKVISNGIDLIQIKDGLPEI
jgi:hypothetical protein